MGGASIASSQSALLLNGPGERRSPRSPPPAHPLPRSTADTHLWAFRQLQKHEVFFSIKQGHSRVWDCHLVSAQPSWQGSWLSSITSHGCAAFHGASWQGSWKRFPHTFKDAMPHRSPRGQNSTPPRPSKGRPAIETPIRWVLPGQRLRLGGGRGGKETPGKFAWSLQEHPSSEGQGDGTGAQGSVQPPRPQITVPSDVETRSPCVD